MLLSKDVSPSSAMTISPPASDRPALRDDTLPPRCHLAIGRKCRLGYNCGSTLKLRTALSVAWLTVAPSTTGIISMWPP
ncbi:hypothetical protein D9M71_719630 [compost metagenome]